MDAHVELHLTKNLLEVSRMFALNLKYCERCSPEELKEICTRRDAFVSISQHIVE